MSSPIPFAHRRNPDGSLDSICTTCFQTIASEDSEGKLIAHEERHTCDPFWQFSRSRFDSRQSTPALPPACGLGYVQTVSGRDSDRWNR
jgi:hypothetical protein